MDRKPTLLGHAIQYFEDLGWCVIPIRSKQKEAMVAWKRYQRERPSETELRGWFGGRTCNIAVIFGQVSGGLACRDFDVAESYVAWAKAHPDLAKVLPTVRTSRGYHVYFRAHVEGITKYRDGELRGAGYCLLPPSVHPSGATYEWTIPPEAPIAEIDPAKDGLCSTAEGVEVPEGLEGLEVPEGLDEIEVPEVTEENRSHNDEIDFLVGGSSDSIDRKILQAIFYTQPSSEGQRNNCIWELCRWLKGIPEIAKLGFPALRPYVQLWHEQARDAIATKEFTETWADFTHAWKRVKWPRGDGALRTAVQRATMVKDPLPEAAAYDVAKVGELIRICLELQRLAGEGPFFLSSYSAAGILDVSPDRANKWLQMLEVDGILAMVKKNTTKLATRFRYVGPSLSRTDATGDGGQDHSV
jgi:hypothetical protein